MNYTEPDIMILTETKLSRKTKSKEVLPSNFRVLDILDLTEKRKVGGGDDSH